MLVKKVLKITNSTWTTMLGLGGLVLGNFWRSQAEGLFMIAKANSHLKKTVADFSIILIFPGKKNTDPCV